MLTHEFGIIDKIDKIKNYSEYEPEQYHCISIDDDIIINILEALLEIETYYHSLNRPNKGLAYYGITLIPPRSYGKFIDILNVNMTNETSKEISKLLALIIEANKQNKYIIHFGI